MKKHTKIYFDAHGITYDTHTNTHEFIPSEWSGREAVAIHHIKHLGRRVDSICALMALTFDEHAELGETGRDEELIECHYRFIDNQIKKGHDLKPLIIKDAMNGCELSKRYLNETTH